MTPHATVVVPTHNRVGQLANLLDALEHQEGAPTFDVVVVLDGCSDGSAAMLSARRSHLGIRPVAQPRRGAACARNAGARIAGGEVLIFLDDDVVPAADLVARHLSHHDGSPRVVVGDCPVTRPGGVQPADLTSWAWWEEFNHSRATSAQRTYRDVCAGNLSIDRRTFVALGGFDERFNTYGWEDWELGIRIQQAGISILVEPRAVAYHHRSHSLRGLLWHARFEGRGDVVIARRYPDLVPGLRLAAGPPKTRRGADRRVVTRPRLGWAEVVLRGWWTEALTRAHIHRRFRAAARARKLAYWVGAREAAGSVAALIELQPSSSHHTRLSIDLATGLPAWLPAPLEVPCELHVSFRGQVVGTVRLPAFRLRGRDELAPVLTRRLRGPLLAAVEASTREACG